MIGSPPEGSHLVLAYLTPSLLTMSGAMFGLPVGSRYSECKGHSECYPQWRSQQAPNGLTDSIGAVPEGPSHGPSGSHWAPHSASGSPSGPLGPTHWDSLGDPLGPTGTQAGPNGVACPIGTHSVPLGPRVRTHWEVPLGDE